MARTTNRSAVGARAVAQYVNTSIAANTHIAYARDLHRFKSWGGKIPATENQLAAYIADSAATLNPSTISRHLAAISFAHTRAGRDSPTASDLVKRTLRGVKRTHGKAVKQARPLTLNQLRRVAQAHHEFSAQQNLRDRALLLVGFAGGFRRSELTALRVGDVDIRRKGAQITLRRAKTDQYAKGRVVAIPRTKNALCAVRALELWMRTLSRLSDDALHADAPLFCRFDRYGHTRPGLDAGSVGRILRKRMVANGLDVTGYSAHSLRAGLVTSAATAGVPLWAIQRQTGHKSVQTVMRYIRNVDAFACNATGAVFAGEKTR